jgi:predicted phage terminase large subunit-like protein
VSDAVAELLEYLSDEERRELDEHLIALGEALPYYHGTLKQFVSECNPRYQWYRHCEEAAEILQGIVDGEISRAMFFLPPRHGKTLLVSRNTPAYYMARHPDRWAGLTSYEATLAQDLSRSCRDAFQRVGGRIRTDSSAVNLWQTVNGGGMWAAGVGGPLTGKGGNLLIIDDPIKNDEEAKSETIRAKHKSWFDSTFSTRLEPGGSMLIVQTRWNEDDLSGYLLAKEALEPEGWTILNLPATAEDTQRVFPVTCDVKPDWRADGQALCPERFDEEALRKIRARVGEYWWSALYQQRPSPIEGGLFHRDWWRYYTEAPKPEEFSFMCQSWDMTFKETKDTDFVVGTVWGIKGPNFYLLDRVRARMDFPTTCEAVRALSTAWPNAVVKYVEDKANGSAVISTLQRSLPGLVAVNPQGGKESRAAGVSPLVKAGNVFLPAPLLAPWVTEFVEECAAFPNAAHDDSVDSMSQALTQIGPMAWEDVPNSFRRGEDHDQTRIEHGHPVLQPKPTQDQLWRRFDHDQMAIANRSSHKPRMPRRTQVRVVPT